LRIIAGLARGRKLLAPGARFGKLVRPTSDRAREAIFNILGTRVAGAAVLDLFAGTGALGLEALSRGAELAVFVEGDRAVLELLGKNASICGFADRSILLRRDLGHGLAFLGAVRPERGFDLVFLDPPYGRKIAHSLLDSLSCGQYLSGRAVVVVEDAALEQYPEVAGALRCFDRRRYGEAGFWLYCGKEAEISE